MAKLEAYFIKQSGEVSLAKTVFVGSDGQQLVCIRGSKALKSGELNFIWSNAVKALSILILKTKLAPHHDDAIIEGGKGSAASSLDYSISKETQWLQDMFGVSASGRPVAKRLIVRSNTSSKRTGPVRATLNIKMLPPTELTVYLNNELASEEAIFDALGSLEEREATIIESSIGEKSQKSSDDNPLLDKKWNDFLKAIYFSEISEILSDTDIFSRGFLNKTMSDLLKNPSFLSVANRKTSLVSEIDEFIAGVDPFAFRLDLTQALHSLNTNLITVAIPTANAGSIVLFEYLKNLVGVNVCVDWRFSSNIQMLNNIKHARVTELPDALVLSAATASVLFNQKSAPKYYPLMLMPRNSYRVVGNNQDGAEDSLNDGEFFFLNDIPSASSFFFDELVSHKHIDRDDVAINHVEPHQMANLYKQAAVNWRTLQWFPYYHFNTILGGGKILFRGGASPYMNRVLCLHESFFVDEDRARSLNLMIRYAWLEMRSSELKLREILEKLLADEDYLMVLFRCLGIDQSLFKSHLEDAA